MRGLKRILALDGGGVRGAISVAFLKRIEEICGEQDVSKKPALCDYFDLIGGTSTGAIIGTTLALGLSADSIRDIYFRLAPRAFRRRWRIAGVQTVFDARALREEIDKIVGDRTLDTQDLRTRLAIVMKRMDTGSAWIVTNSPRSKYWDDAVDGSYIGNRYYRLAALVRASTAAPYFFAPETIAVVDGETPGLFIDGGITPHNNPSLALLQVATIPAYGFAWPTGADRLHIISIGTGTHRPSLNPRSAHGMMAAGLAVKALTSLISDGGAQVLTMMQILGRTDTPWTINSEVGDLAGVLLPPEPLFTFQRYDVKMDKGWLHDELGFSFTERDVERLCQFDRPENIPLVYEIGRAAAEKFVKPEHFFDGGIPAQREGSTS